MFRTHKFLSIFALFALLLTTGCPGDTEEGGEEGGEESGEEEGSAEGEAEGEGEEGEEGEGEEAAEEGGEEAAAGGLAGQFQGTWNLDTAATMEASLAEMPEAEQEAARAMMEAMMGAMQLSVTVAESDITMSVSMMGESQDITGTWEALGEEGQVLNIRTSMNPAEGSGEPEVTEGTVTFTDAGITMNNGEGEILILTRAE